MKLLQKLEKLDIVWEKGIFAIFGKFRGKNEKNPINYCDGGVAWYRWGVDCISNVCLFGRVEVAGRMHWRAEMLFLCLRLHC